jgi:hypothetical protein
MPQQKKTTKPATLPRWPVVLAGVGITALVLLLFLSPSPIGLFAQPGSSSSVSNIFLICLVLCPMLICGFALYAILLAAIYGVNVVERSSRRQLQKARRATRTVADKTNATADNINQRSINIGTKMAALDHVFTRAEEKEETDE